MNPSLSAPELLLPDWPAPQGVRALITTRRGGVSAAPYDSFNLGGRAGDDPACVAANRAALRKLLPSGPVWLQQVHGAHVVDADVLRDGSEAAQADAAVARSAGTVCAIMTADCLPVLFAARDGSVVAAAHAGWRGLCAGVLENTVKTMGMPAHDLLAYFGPAIGPAHFEVGPEVRSAFIAHDPMAAQAFQAGQADRWMADIFMLARQRLLAAGVVAEAIFGGHDCTVTDAARFYSYRLAMQTGQQQTGRMAALIWRT